MSAQIIQFGKQAITPRRVAVPDPTGDEAEPVAERAITATAKNSRLRNELKEAWRKAAAVTNYWRAMLDLHHAVEMAAREGLREACLQKGDFDEKGRWYFVDSYREAVRKQIFTPAPDLAAVNWKRAHLDRAIYAGAKMERMEQIIANDLVFIKAHPTRKDHALRAEN